MPISFPHYNKIRDNYCCCYLGISAEYIVALRLLKPQIEKQLPGLKLWIGCRDEFKYLLTGESQVIFLNEMEKRKNEFAYIREIRNNTNNHSILDLMDQSELKIDPIPKKVGDVSEKVCLICPEGIEPTKSMSEASLDIAIHQTMKLGYTPIVVGSDVHHSIKKVNLRPQGEDKIKYAKSAGWIIGVENEYLFLGASNSIKTTLVQSGIGTSLFKQLFPYTEII